MHVLEGAVFHYLWFKRVIIPVQILCTFNMADVTSDFLSIIFVIVDTGIIIDMKYVDNIYHPFRH